MNKRLNKRRLLVADRGKTTGYHRDKCIGIKKIVYQTRLFSCPYVVSKVYPYLPRISATNKRLGLTKMRYRCCYDIFIIYYDISAAAARWPRAPTATRLLLVALQGLFTRVLIIVEIPRNPGPGFSSRRSRNSILVSHTKCVNFGIFPHSEL